MRKLENNPVKNGIKSKHTPDPDTRKSSHSDKVRPEYDHLFKVRIVGDTDVGRSSLMNRFIDDAFTEDYKNTTSIDFKIKTIEIEGARVKLQIWDTNKNGLSSISSSGYYSGTHAYLVVFDVTKQETFSCVCKWLQLIDNFESYHPNKLVLLIGNKADLISERTVTFEKASDFAESLGLLYIETSAKDGDNVELAFANIAKMAKDHSEGNDFEPITTLEKEKINPISIAPLLPFYSTRGDTNSDQQQLIPNGSICCNLL